MTTSQSNRDPVERLAEEFLARRRDGQAASISEYAEKYPQWSQRIRDLFPTLLLLEDFQPAPARPHAASAVLPGSGSVPGDRLGDYRIVREIGRGGMGIVYEAEQESLGRRVALKVLPALHQASPTRLRRFHREARAAARLHHTNIVPVFGVGQQGDLHYYVMQYIPGLGLDRILATLGNNTTAPEAAHALEDLPTSIHSRPPQRPPPTEPSKRPSPEIHEPGPTEAADATEPEAETPVLHGLRPSEPSYWRAIARIGVQVADALEYAHQQGTLHRDIKPANLLLDTHGTAWVADFGLAKSIDIEDLTRSDDVAGTLRYMAPERLHGQADARSDVYSLGLTLYELLTLRPAFDEQDRQCLIRQLTQQEPPRPRLLTPAIPLDLETIVLKAIASHPEHRYQTAGQLAADLQCFLEDRPIRARRTTPLARLWRWCRRNRAVAALSGTALALLAAVAVVASIGYLRTHRALERVSEQREQAELARAQAEQERAHARSEHRRAETNLGLAIKAFEDLFGKIAADPPAASPEQADDDEPWENVVSGRDAALLETMLRFYDQFAEQNQASVALQRDTARAYRRVGDIQQQLGQYDRAETAYRHALEIYQRLAKDSSNNGAGVAPIIAGIDNELGTVLRRIGRYPEAHDAHRAAAEVLRALPADVAAQPECRFELAQTYRSLSFVMPFHGRPKPGPGWNRPTGEPSLLSPASPADRGRPIIASRESNAGRASPSEPGFPGENRRPYDIAFQGINSRNREGADNNRHAIEILRQLVGDEPDNPRYRLAMARCQRDRSVIAAHAGSGDEARAARQKAIELLERLVADLPGSPSYRYELAETYAMPPPPEYRDHEGPDDAAEQLRRAMNILTELAGSYPNVPEYRASLARAHFTLAEISCGRGSLADAEDHARKAVGLQKNLAAQCASVPFYGLHLARWLRRLAEIQAERKEPAEARLSLKEAVGALEALRQSSSATPPSRFWLAIEYAGLARTLRELGETALAEQVSAEASRSGFDPSSWPPGPPGHRHAHRSLAPDATLAPAGGDKGSAAK